MRPSHQRGSEKRYSVITLHRVVAKFPAVIIQPLRLCATMTSTNESEPDRRQ